MAETTKRIFVSDVHLGRGAPTDWFKPAHTSKFQSALQHVLANSDTIKDLVLLGDIFDTWIVPVREKPDPVDVIATRHPEIIDVLKQCGDKLSNVFYLNGNHDMGVEQSDLDAIFGAGKIQHIPRYHAGMLYAEHGNAYALFNAPDPVADPADSLPLGYYISRIVAGHEDYETPGAVLAYIDDIIETMVTPETVPQGVLQALMERYGYRDSDEVVMPGARPNVTLGDVKKRYSTLLVRWIQRYGHIYTFDSIRSELNSLGWAADRLCKDNGYRVVVFGHTHHASEDLDRWLVAKERLYVNSGYFCTDDPSLVEVDKDGDKLIVKLLAVQADGSWQPRKPPIVIGDD